MTATERPPETAAEIDGERLEAWRLKTIRDLGITNSVILHSLDEEEVLTAGDLLDVYADWQPGTDSPLLGKPFNLSGWQVGDLHERMRETALAAGLDPLAVLPWLAPLPTTEADEPVVVDATPPPADPTDLEAWDAETARLVADMEGETSELEGEWEERHADAALAKKAFEQRRDKMRAFIRERRDQRGKPYPKPEKTLFDGVADGTDPDASDPLADLWQQYHLDAYRWERWGLTAKDVEKLNSGETKNHGTHPLLTLGDVTRFITPNPANPAYARTLKDVKGFGDKGMERWTEAEVKFWAWWNAGGKQEFAAERGLTVEAGAKDANPTGAGGGDAGGGGDPHAEAGAGAEPTLADPDIIERPPQRLKPNAKTGELEPVGDAKPKGKPKGKAKGKAK